MGRAATRKALIVHFLHRHIRYTMVVLEEGKLLHPKCPRCYIMVAWEALNGRQTTTTQEIRAITERDFQAYSRPLNLVISFKYLVWIMTVSNGGCPEVVGNL